MAVIGPDVNGVHPLFQAQLQARLTPFQRLRLPGDHPFRCGTGTGATGDSRIPFLHPDDGHYRRGSISDK
jgi:hypothetical protein